MTDLWGVIKQSDWQDVPFLGGRVASAQDVKDGIAVFHVDGESEPVEMPLPRAAVQIMEDGTRSPVVVIQAERVPSGVLLGVRPLQGGYDACLEEEVEYLEGFDSGDVPG